MKFRLFGKSSTPTQSQAKPVKPQDCKFYFFPAEAKELDAKVEFLKQPIKDGDPIYLYLAKNA